MALRSISGITFQSMHVARLLMNPSQIPLITLPNSSFHKFQTSSFHTNRLLYALDKNVISTKDSATSATEKQESSFAAASSGPVFPELPGFTDAGITIPTLETHSAIIDGVRYDELPIVHIKASPNNTIISVFDYKGKEKLGRSSCGQEGFKNVKKSTNVAAQATGLSVGTKLTKSGIHSVRVLIKGIGAGRLASIKGLQMGGVRIVSITDNTPTIHDAPRPRKARRL